MLPALSLFIDEKGANKHQFRLVALDSSQKRRSEWTAATLAVTPIGSSFALTFEFTQPLSALGGFELLGREIQVAEFHDVVLQPPVEP